MKVKIKSFSHSMKRKVETLAIRAKIKADSATAILKDQRGDQNSSLAGWIIVGIIIAGLAVVWVNKNFPDFFDNMGDRINDLFDL